MKKLPPPDDFDEIPEWTDEMIDRSRPAGEVHPPHIVAALVRRRGPQVAPVKTPVTLRLDPDVLEKFRATGPGWQTRINEVLRRASV